MQTLKKFYFGKLKSCRINYLDTDALAFINATGITDVTQKDSIFELVSRLKCKGLWTKLDVIYPFIGGTAFTHKFNLKDPRDLDVANRLTYSGTVTHSLNGITDTTSAQINTYFIPASKGYDIHYSAYCRNNIVDAYLFYSFVSINSILQIFARISNLFLADMYNDAGLVARNSITNTSSIGFFLTQISISNFGVLVKNGSALVSKILSGGIPPNSTLFLGKSTGTQGLNKSFVTIGRNLSVNENVDLYNIIQIYQTALGRQI